MRSFRLFALMLVTVAAGCAQSRLFSRAGAKDVDEPSSHAAAPADAASLTDAKLNRELDSRNSGFNREPIRPTAASLPIAEHLERAELAFKAQRFSEAQQHLDAIIQQQPAHPRAHHLLAVIADLEGRFGDAEHHYHAALQSDPGNAAIIGDLGYSYLLQNRLSLAEQYLLQARALAPSRGNAINLARLCSRRNDLTGAQQALADVLPPNEMLETLAPLFPGVPTDVLLGQAVPNAAAPMQSGQTQMYAASHTDFATVQPPTGGPVGVDPFAQSMPQYQASMVAAPPIASAHPNVPPQFHSAMPVVEPQGTNAILYAGTDPNAQIMMVNPPGGAFAGGAPTPASGIAQASASLPSPAWAAGGPSAPAVPAPETRRWPPALWPPALWPPQSSTAQPAAAQPMAAAPTRPSSGVTYLMPRRPATPAVPPPSQFVPDPQSGSAAAQAWPGSTQFPLARDPVAAPAVEDSQAQYQTGPGSSRIVTWPNRNGLSLGTPPLPPTNEQPPSNIAVPAINAPTSLRSSPGAASGWNGGMYPPPQRQLTSSGPSMLDDTAQGVPGRQPAMAPQATASATDPANAGSFSPNSPPHAGFTFAPSTATPENPLAGYEAERRAYDQQFQEQVDRTYGRSPAGFIPPPSANMPTPRYEVPAATMPGAAGPPLSQTGTPWPSTPVGTSAPGAGSPTANGTAAVTPPPYRPLTGTAQRPAPLYRRPAPPSSSAPYYEAPTIVPGR